MKKIIVSLGLLTCFFAANAQTQEKNWMLGGSFELNTAKNNTVIAFNPSIAGFVIDNFAVGGNLSFVYTKAGSAVQSTSFGIGPFVRYYFTTETQTVRPIVQSSFNYLNLNTKLIGTGTSSNSGWSYFLGGGAAAFINKNVSIDALMGYDHTKYKTLAGSGGFSFKIGFQVYINRSELGDKK